MILDTKIASQLDPVEVFICQSETMFALYPQAHMATFSHVSLFQHFFLSLTLVVFFIHQHVPRALARTSLSKMASSCRQTGTPSWPCRPTHLGPCPPFASSC